MSKQGARNLSAFKPRNFLNPLRCCGTHILVVGLAAGNCFTCGAQDFTASCRRLKRHATFVTDTEDSRNWECSHGDFMPRDSPQGSPTPRPSNSFRVPYPTESKTLTVARLRFDWRYSVALSSPVATKKRGWVANSNRFNAVSVLSPILYVQSTGLSSGRGAVLPM